jgi:hypothetical protein
MAGAVLVLSMFPASCVDQQGREASVASAESCMRCHNGSLHDDYAGPGLENPHPFPGDAEMLRCTACHGGNPNGADAATSHVPPPPSIGDRDFQDQNAQAYFNKLTLAGIDKVDDYEVDGVTYTGLQYLQFLNPSDLRVTSIGQGCGECHQPHATASIRSPIGSEMGIFSGAFYAVGMANAIAAHQGLFEDTAADYGWRAVVDPAHVHDPNADGKVGENYDGETVTLAVDSAGNPLRHVEVDSSGNYWLTSKVDGRRHYVSQTLDVIVDNGKTNPVTGTPIYTQHGSFAMGRDDNDPATGIGSQQTGSPHAGFSHMDSMHCASCHSAWSNSCVGCHLEGEYNEGNNFSNITGERIAFRERFAEFVYQSPIPFTLGIGPDNDIRTTAANTKVFFRYRDINGDRTPVFAFSDRNGQGGNTVARPTPSLGHNALMAHSIRGRVSATNEGPRSCVACHLTNDAITNYGSQYAAFRTALYANDYGNLDYNLLRQHIGQNPGNQLDSPFFVHMVAGLGTGLYLFDQNGAAQNPLDDNDDRYGSDGAAPNTYFNPADVRYDLDRVVETNGVANGSSSIPMNQPFLGPLRRDGALDPNMTGPLGTTLALRLADPATGIVLNSWVDADRTVKGDASNVIDP